MKFSTQFLIFSLSPILSLSLILYSFADDDRKGKRYRYRGGYQKIDDDNGGGDDHDHLKPVANQVYRMTCGECHFAYQPGLLPSESWMKILDRLDDHFGEDLDVDPDIRVNISDYLKNNAAEKSSAKLSVKIVRCLEGWAPIRITDVPYIRKEHYELDPAVIESQSIGSLSNCIACHITAENGIYDDDSVKIPR